MKKHFITCEQTLADICHYFSTCDVIAVDTEFVRTRTYYPKLGLIQVCDGQQLALIDPVAIENLCDFWRLIDNENVTKVIHACSEDIEIFIQQGQCSPKNVIDSQIAMSFLGHGLSIGYAAMVEHYLGISLDKSDSRTDWTKRPLTESQLSYAQADVEYLAKIYPILMKDLSQTPWQAAAFEDSQLLVAKKRLTIDADTVYLNVKMAWKLSGKQLNNLKQLAKWRYEQALSRDLPLSFVAKDNTLIACAQYSPKSVGAMAKLNGADIQDVRYRGKQIIAVLKKAQEIQESDFPPRIKRLDSFPGYKQNFKKIKEYVLQVGADLSLPAENIASKKQINQFLSWYYKQEQQGAVDLLNGWRLNTLGNALLASAKSQFMSL